MCHVQDDIEDSRPFVTSHFAYFLLVCRFMKPTRNLMKGTKISATRSIMVHVMGPMDANHYGYVHGGVIMRAVDEAAFIPASRHAKRNVVTAAIDNLSFECPVHIGDLLILKSQVNYVGKTSMELGVRIETENPIRGEIKLV